jgi:hypothetical protein
MAASFFTSIKTSEWSLKLTVFMATTLFSALLIRSFTLKQNNQDDEKQDYNR